MKTKKFSEQVVVNRNNKMVLNRILLCMMASSLYVCTDIYQLHMMIFALNERRRQIRSNMRMLTLSRRFFIDKKMAAKRKGRMCWEKGGRTKAWWTNFEKNLVAESEWKYNFRILRPYLTKRATTASGVLFLLFFCLNIT